MSRRVLGLLAISVILAGGCGNLGLGEAECVPPSRDVSSANILTVQAVPTARYTPCLNGVPLGWESVTWFAEDGRAGLEVFRTLERFLSAVVTPSCDPGLATEVASGYADIRRFEDIESQPAEVGITIVPSAERPLIRANIVAEEMGDEEIDGRPIVITIDDAIDQPVGSRVNLALLQGDYVWIIDELDAEEGTVEMRSSDPAATGSGLTPEAALELIEDTVPEVFYRGSWYFLFEGGCITYEFDATGTLAESVAADAELALGFYEAYELIRVAEEAGFELFEPADD